MATFVPVDNDPFSEAPSREARLAPVDFDPFAEGDVTQTPTQKQMAPAKGVFPAVRQGQGAVVPADTFEQQPPQTPGTIAPKPAPERVAGQDPGFVAESVGDVIKGTHAMKRGAFLSAYTLGQYDDVDNIAANLAASQDLEAQYPSSRATQKAQEELNQLKDSGLWGVVQAGGIYAKNPRLAASTALQSLPSMLPSLVTVPVGAAAGSLVGPVGTGAGAYLGMAVGSGAADYGSSLEDYARDKWKLKTKDEWRAFLLDPERYNEASKYAAWHAGMVGAFDALGAKGGGKLAMSVGGRVLESEIAQRVAGKAGQKVAAGAAGAGAGVAVDVVAGPAGEAAGQIAGSGQTGGGYRITDPGAVAGEAAGAVVTGPVGPVIEATTHRLGGERATPATAEDIAAATQAIQPPPSMETPAPEAVSGSVTSQESPAFYSTLTRFVQDKGQNSATPDQWLATFRNDPTVKAEEVRDTGLEDFLTTRNGKVTKGEILDHLQENSIRLTETWRDNVDSPTLPGLRHAKYEAQTLPGERQGYVELTLESPTRNTEGDNTQRDFVGGHYPQPNVVVHARVTDRTDVNGTPLALIEEIQSDWHQAGARNGYMTPEAQDLLARQRELNRQYWEARDARDVRRAMEITQQTREVADQLDAMGVKGGTVPEGPFKQSWQELAFRRILRWAADKGYRRIAWVNAAEQSRRYPGSAQRDAGMVQFYDKVVPSIAKRWAKRLGGTMGTSAIPVGAERFQVFNQDGDFVTERSNEQDARDAADMIGGTVRPAQSTTENVQYIDLSQAALDAIQRGLPLYSEMGDIPAARAIEEGERSATGPRVDAYKQRLVPALQELMKGFKFSRPVKVVFHNGRSVRFGVGMNPKTGKERFRRAEVLGMAVTYPKQYEIHLALGWHNTTEELWATATHEMGHIVMWEKFNSASPSEKTAIYAAYNEWKSKVPENANMRQMLATRDNAIVSFYNTRTFSDMSSLDKLSPSKRQYWTGFEEWFAEQVARWGTTNVKPLSFLERFFKGIGSTIADILFRARQMFPGLDPRPAAAMQDWLNSFHTDAAPFAEDIKIVNDVKTQTDNQTKMGPEEKGEEMQPETVTVRDGVNKIFNGRPPREVQETLAYADKFNKIYKWGLGIHQVAQRNPHITPLQEYTETIAVATLTKQQIMARAQEILKRWNRLGGWMGDNLAAFMDDVQNMVYLTPDEVKNKVTRFPTQQEIAQLAKKHQMSQEALGVFREIATSFQEHLTRYEAVLRNEAKKITDPKQQADRMDDITLQIRALRAKPYFPAMRFGDFTLTIRDAGGKVIHFETFESERQRRRAVDAIKAGYAVPDTQVQLGRLDKQVKPLMGVPTQLLNLMGEKLTLSTAQRDALEQLKFELSPAQSFKHRFQHKRRIAGYSQDFRRAYANYFFHGANHFMRVMYADRLRELTRTTRDQVKDVYDATTRHEIVAYMNDHLENWLDPKSDWAAIRSIAFLWSLAFSPAAAAQNLTQTLMTTYPFLAQQFGDTKAVGALMRTGADFSTFYKKGKLEKMTDFELRAIARGVQDGIITEAMAPELAGIAEGRTLGLGFGGNELQRGLHTFNEWGAKMFELAEQVNRRLSFRAALKLAQENPDASYVKAMPEKHRLHYEELRRQGWTEAEATAYVTARDATITTQFQYGREYQPRFMRGKQRSIFVFKTFIQNYCVFLWNYPQAAIRSLLIMGFLGGLMGVPGAEDLEQILKALAWRMLGKDFDLEKEARKLLIQMVGEDETGRQTADMVLHGIARQGYGIPILMDMVGGTAGIDIPFPTFDRSAALSAGTLLPVELGKLFGPPVQDQDTVIAGQAQKASGAVFGAGFNIYKALTNSKLDWGDSKRWERAVPRAIGSVWKAFRVGNEGRERSATGSTVVKYDVRDTEQLMEVIGIALGYTPYRQSLQWNRIMAGQEAVKLWDIRRQGLMKQYGNAVLGRDTKEIERVRGAILDFNKNLPTEARGKAITSDVLRQSLGTQARSRRAQEAEGSVRRGDIPILREVQKLYPESRATSIRRVQGTP